jgi:type IV secretory pathway TrbF-like protein
VVAFVVAVNDLHQVVGMGFADETSVANPLLVQARHQQYIENVRSVASDPLVLKDRLTSVFDGTVLSSAAFNYLQELWRNDSPFTRAETETVQVTGVGS